MVGPCFPERCLQLFLRVFGLGVREVLHQRLCGGPEAARRFGRSALGKRHEVGAHLSEVPISGRVLGMWDDVGLSWSYCELLEFPP